MKDSQLLILAISLVLFTSSTLKADIILQEYFVSSTLSFSGSYSNQQGATKWWFQNSFIPGMPSGNVYVVFDDAALRSSVTPNKVSLTTRSIDCSTRPYLYRFGVVFRQADTVGNVITRMLV